ncbi:MAG: hypothetical protein KU29_13740 [Sulfurovum sp. FS06-10]|nr:MAG: hypothetical protein KU29_13740 [Sulfurovum sp. FS06-10]
MPEGFAPGVGYSVSINSQPKGQECTVANNVGLFSYSNINNINVSCKATLTPPPSGLGLVFDNVIGRKFNVDVNGDVFALVSDGAGGRAVRKKDISKGTELNLIVSNALSDFHVSNNGKFIAYSELNQYGKMDILLKSMESGVTKNITSKLKGGVSNQSGNYFHPFISKNGNYLVFSAIDSGFFGGELSKVVLYDVLADKFEDIDKWKTQKVNGDCFSPSVNEDGSLVFFLSTATNLDGKDVSTFTDLYLYTRSKGEFRLLSVGDIGMSGIGEVYNYDLRGDGSEVVFESSSPDLISSALEKRKNYIYRYIVGDNKVFSMTNELGEFSNCFYPRYDAEGKLVSMVCSSIKDYVIYNYSIANSALRKVFDCSNGIIKSSITHSNGLSYFVSSCDVNGKSLDGVFNMYVKGE